MGHDVVLILSEKDFRRVKNKRTTFVKSTVETILFLRLFIPPEYVAEYFDRAFQIQTSV